MPETIIISDLDGTALKVLETTHIPVLLVRRPEPGTYRDIVIATDFSAAAERAAHMALDCFPAAPHALIRLVPLEASMRMGGAREEDIERYREREFAAANSELGAFARRCTGFAAGGRLEQLALHGSPAAVLFDQVRARGSVTQNILYHAGCDMLLSAA